MDDLFSSALFFPASDNSLLVQFGKSISVEAHTRVARLTNLVLADMPKGFLNVHPAYNSVLVSFDPSQADHGSVEQVIRNIAGNNPSSPREERVVTIPTCYNSEFGPDLTDVARHCGLSEDEVVRTHTAADYLVYFLGFTPGFPYLGGMPTKLTTPRLGTPRKHVPAGSVAIGGSQTGIYSVDSPGGWRIIGRTPLKLFDVHIDPPTLLHLGDRVRFKDISLAEFEKTSLDGRKL